MQATVNGHAVAMTVEEVVAFEASRAPDPAAARAALVRHYDAVVQGRLDAVAQSFGYGDPNRPQVSPILHAVSYADESAVPEFQAEGQALRAWRSRTWAAAAQMLAQASAGNGPPPTDAQVLAALEAAAPAPVPAA